MGTHENGARPRAWGKTGSREIPALVTETRASYCLSRQIRSPPRGVTNDSYEENGLLKRTGFAIGAATGVLATGYVLVVRGALTLDIGVGRSIRPLGPIEEFITAPPEVVFDVIAAPYLGPTPKAMESKLHVLVRGTDLVLAEHFTPAGGGLVATTVETVKFDRPHRIDFRLLRGPVPHVVETFELRGAPGGTKFGYTGEMGADLWGLGRWWSNRVAARWERTVQDSLNSIKAEAERRARARAAGD